MKPFFQIIHVLFRYADKDSDICRKNMLNCIHNLVFYTIFSHFAEKCGIQVIGLCIMVDHIHALIIQESRKQMSEFILLYSSFICKAVQ